MRIGGYNQYGLGWGYNAPLSVVDQRGTNSYPCLSIIELNGCRGYRYR